MCLNPKWIYKKGFYKENNHNGAKGQFYELGCYAKCGSCIQCNNEKSNNWVIRNFYEEKNHEKKCFVTLTYEKNPIILVKKDLQDFIKRLRERIKPCKIRYFAVGEYGTKKNRPHFHIIIYGWEDENIKYLDISKSKKIIYQSKIIQETWGKGRTSYQKFSKIEIPYISLYETAKETYKKEYKFNFEQLKKLKSIAKNKNLNESVRKNLLKEISELEKDLENKKGKYVCVKEFNTWSIALGWESFEKEYTRTDHYVFKEYINEKEFVTPSPWVKKLANQGYIDAHEELKRREEDTKIEASEEAEKLKNIMQTLEKRKKELKEWNTERKNGAKLEF